MKKRKPNSDDILPEYDFTGGKRGRYYGKISPGPAKVKITMFVDSDVLSWFKKRSEEPGALPYQRQMQMALRKSMEMVEKGGDPVIALLDNDHFIQQVAEKVRNFRKVS
jgi:uncharacterized protein (DUF4415 family)